MPDVQGMINSIMGTTTLLIAGSFVFSIVIILFVRRAVMPNTRLLTTGEPAQAKIVRFWDTGVTVNDNPMVGFLLEVYPTNRAAYQVEHRSMIPRLSIGMLQQGAMVNVRIDPADPRKLVFAA
jgi:hypothetical protein